MELDKIKLEKEIEDFEDRIQASLEVKEDNPEDSWSYRRAIVRINCYNLARKRLKNLKEWEQ